MASAAFLFLLTTGLLLRYQLPPHSSGLHGPGAGERPVTLLWGWTRHEWGDIHYWIAGVLLAILAVHVALHWKWVICVVRGAHSDASGLRFGLGIASLVALLLLAGLPLLMPTQSIPRGELQQEPWADQTVDEHDDRGGVRGSMTVAEGAKAAGLTVAQFLDRANLPPDIAPNERIGRVLRRHK